MHCRGRSQVSSPQGRHRWEVLHIGTAALAAGHGNSGSNACTICTHDVRAEWACRHKLYAFSNGKYEDVEALLNAADLMKFFTRVVSVDDVRSFKPDPSVYLHFLSESESTASVAWLVSSNPFDVIGAS